MIGDTAFCDPIARDGIAGECLQDGHRPRDLTDTGLSAALRRHAIAIVATIVY